MGRIAQFKINMPAELKEQVAAAAAKNMRSMSKEIIFILTEKMQAATGAKFGDQTPAAAPSHSDALAGVGQFHT